ncbi:MAG: prolipoprotein diacylglyceryl transferase family protein, partial [Anaerolineales bacterium]
VSFYHPLFGYESLLNIANMLLLLWLGRRYAGRLKRGDLFNVYLIAYPLIRFSLDFLRLDASKVLSININQTLMAVVGIGAILVFIWRHRPGSAEPAESEMMGGSERMGMESETAASEAVVNEPAMDMPSPEVTPKRTTRRPATRKTTTKAPARRKTAPK